MAIALHALPDEIAGVLSVAQIKRALNLKLHPQRIRRARQDRVLSALLTIQELVRRKGIRGMAEQQALKMAKLPERIAAIVAKTYTVFGDGAPVADDEALGMIRDLLDELDESLIERSRAKRLARRAS